MLEAETSTHAPHHASLPTHVAYKLCHQLHARAGQGDVYVRESLKGSPKRGKFLQLLPTTHP